MWGDNGGVVTLSPKMNRAHMIDLPPDWGVDVDGGGTEIYAEYLPQVMKLVTCMVDRCPAMANNPGRPR